MARKGEAEGKGPMQQQGREVTRTWPGTETRGRKKKLEVNKSWRGPSGGIDAQLDEV